MADCSRLTCFPPRWVIPVVCLMSALVASARTAVIDTVCRGDEVIITRHVPPAAVSRYPYGVTFLRPWQLDSVLNYADTELVPIIFKRDKTDLLLPNAGLDSIVEVVRQILGDKEAGLKYVWIGGSASPEGPEAHNVWLGKTRAGRLYDYLKAHTAIPDSLIRMENLMEDWHTPLKLIRQLDFPNKERTLEIWADQPDIRKRKREIMAIDGGKTWEYLIDEAFRPARNARMVIVCAAKDSTETFRYLKPQSQLPWLVRAADSIPAVIRMTALPVYRGGFVALKTNLAALGLLVANIGVEFSFGRGFSLDLPFYYSPYDITSRFRVRIFGTQPELRYWLNRDLPGDGHFFGLNGTVSGFNISFPGSDRFQDPEHALWGVGLSYGYALSFGSDRRWGLEFNIGAGYMNYHLDTFENVYNGRLVKTREKSYWGITRVGFSLTYKFRRCKQTGLKISSEVVYD